ncbi:ribosome biogenesis (Nop4) [Penicillium argentinense]|uniref:Ribosome biogenesis (Nop4) n=1 Tax=Penicillium argentinense TaxID=1131581 RepID=A0A9W9F7U6_9EURO|nr:ribosome biogenesis (Nop4) [Penicillium argentinense]KAJ5095217.1 ribosome biogenesis (Nop4) [Penicillium argentinense]
MAEPHKKRRLSDEGVAQDTEVKMDEPKTETAATSTAAKPNRTLFVRSLPASATTESLAEFFSQSYVLKHTVAVNNPETKQCKGYGFVTFADLEDAQSAVEELNGADFEGKKIRVEYAQQRHREIDEKLGKSKPAANSQKAKQEREDQQASNQPPKLIIRNLPWSIKTTDDLALLFRSFGKVKWADLPKQNNKLRGFGFVILRGKKNAEKALEAVNGKEIDGRTLAVDWAVDRETWENVKKEDEEEEENKEDEDVDMEDKPSAEDDEDETSSDEDDDEEEDDAEDEDEDDIDDDFQEQVDKEEIEDDRHASTIFLRNLPFTCTDDSLYEHFTQFGPLRYARIVVDQETERPRGTGFVCFWKPDDCATCPPKQQDTLGADKERSKPAMKHSVLQNENSDPTGRYTMDGRVLHVARAVNKREAAKLNEEGVSRRLVRDKDKRRLYLLSEGTIPSNSPLYKKLSPSEIKMREESYKQRESFIKKNPALHLSLTRLSIRNMPRHVTSKDLKQLAREAVVGFAKDVKAEKRQPLSREEQQRSRDTMKELEHERKEKKAGIVRQAKVVFETREGTKVPEKAGGGRSRGYGFIEYYTHRHALMGLRWLNCHPIEIPANADSDEKDKRKRLIVEFAIENAQVIKRRQELQEKKKQQAKERAEKAGKEEEEDKSQQGQKRKRSESRGKGKDGKPEEEGEDEKVAKRNRIIGKKRAQRKARGKKA